MKRIWILLLLATPMFGQEIPPANQVYVFDSKGGEAQYRPIVTPVWNPLTAGMRMGERTLIRLSSPDSVLTLRFPDGSLLRLFGLGSYYLDRINRIISNTNQTRILLLTGRWFYSSNPLEKARFVVSSDVTTSVIINGSGGGFFYDGTSEMIVRSGQGLFGWRQQNMAPFVIGGNQILRFNVRDGFTHALEQAQISNYMEYGLTEPEVTNQQALRFQPYKLIADKRPVTIEQIDLPSTSLNTNSIQRDDIFNPWVVKSTTPALSNHVSASYPLPATARQPALSLSNFFIPLPQNRILSGLKPLTLNAPTNTNAEPVQQDIDGYEDLAYDEEYTDYALDSYDGYDSYDSY
ncbi:MAG: hypothetical protein ACRCY4_01930 [Brevinema sp.]